MSAHRPARRRARIALVSAISLGLAAVPLTLGAPAQASSYACTVTPHRPDYSYTNADGKKVLNYRITIYCAQDRYVNYVRNIMEDDDWPNPDDTTARTYLNNEHFAAGESYTYSVYYTLPNTEDGNEEMYHMVSFQEGSGGVWSSWSGWIKSRSLSISN